jgi:anti-anti-sigma factor
MQGGALRLVVSGELDMSTSGVLATAISDALADGIKAVSVDLGNVSFLDSSGIRALIDGWRLALKHGVEYRVINPRGLVERVLDVSGVLPVLNGSRVPSEP